MSLSSPLLTHEHDLEDNDAPALGDMDDEEPLTSLDKTINRIGMGNYQWTLLALCGFGWMADNMWLESISIILPRVQQHFSVPDSYIGTLFSSLFGGMMIGAVGWGTCSDLIGRSFAFNGTLFFTALFGLLASFAQSFWVLCLIMFMLGTAVGGSMPTDGTLLLEHMPRGKEYLVTALSVFFSFGAILAAIAALVILPSRSCHSSQEQCDVLIENQGWQYLLMILGLLSFAMFLGRMVFFRLYESPRFLVHVGKPQDAIHSLQAISKYNRNTLILDLEDVDDSVGATTGEALPESPVEQRNTLPFAAKDFDPHALHLPGSPSPPKTSPMSEGVKDYSAASVNSHTLDYNFTDATPALTFQHASSGILGAVNVSAPVSPIATTRNSRYPIPPPRPLSTRKSSRYSSYEARRRCGSFLPRWIRRPLWGWLDRIQMVLEPEWKRTTILTWLIWCAMSTAFTMFNVFLPKLLETGRSPGKEKTLEGSLWSILLYTSGGFPGALVGAWLIETRLGRRGSLALSTFITAAFCLLFIWVDNDALEAIITMVISLCATTMWAVLYGWTPEIFGPKVRGTVGGIASALSRIGGMIAPLLGGPLLMIDRAAPVYASVVIFLLAGTCVLMLDENAGDSGRVKGKATVLH